MIPRNRATVFVSGLESRASLDSIQEFCGTPFVNIQYAQLRRQCRHPFLASSRCRGAPPKLSITHLVVPVKIHLSAWEYATIVHDFLDKRGSPLCSQAKYCLPSRPLSLHRARPIYPIQGPGETLPITHTSPECPFASRSPPYSARPAYTRRISGSNKETIVG